jgi:hypothetical protein
VRERTRLISIGTAPLLIEDSHLRPPHTSMAITSAGAKIRLSTAFLPFGGH